MIAYRALPERDIDSLPPPVSPQGFSDRVSEGYSPSRIDRLRADPLSQRWRGRIRGSGRRQGAKHASLSWRQTFCHSVPYDFNLDTVVTMTQPVSHAPDIAPRNLRACSGSIVPHPRSGLRNLKQLALDCGHGFRIAKKCIQIHTRGKFPDTVNAFENVLKRHVWLLKRQEQPRARPSFLKDSFDARLDAASFGYFGDAVMISCPGCGLNRSFLCGPRSSLPIASSYSCRSLTVNALASTAHDERAPYWRSCSQLCPIQKALRGPRRRPVPWLPPARFSRVQARCPPWI